MDEGIHLPAPLRHELEDHMHIHLNVVDEADEALKKFQEMMSDAYTDCSSLQEAAKDLYKEVFHNINGGKLKVYQGTLALDQFDRDLTALLGKQQPKWDQLKAKEAIMRTRLQKMYEPIHAAELHVRDAKGDGKSNEPQKELAKVYSHRLKRNFHDAKVEYDELMGFPDGLLTQIDLLHKRAETESREIIEKLRKREKAVFKVPAVLYKMVGA
jgi:hypothetical protein